jgi:hypothetical protein
MFIVHCQSDWGGIQVVYHFEVWKCKKQRIWNLHMVSKPLLLITGNREDKTMRHTK